MLTPVSADLCLGFPRKERQKPEMAAGHRAAGCLETLKRRRNSLSIAADKNQGCDRL